MARSGTRAATAMIALFGAGSLGAAPLCRDGKGLFTPCPREANRTARAILSHQFVPPTRTPPVREQVPVPERQSPKKHLCTDSKGLFTPCPR